MRVARIIIVLGIILTVFGVIFQYQGKGVIGPESSFMYYNKDWINYGISILVLGIITIGIGIFYSIRR